MAYIDKKFEDAPRTAVLISRFVVREMKEITSIFHHEYDGMWEFIGVDRCEEDSDYLLVSLEEVVMLDPTVQAVADLSLGWCAYRGGVGMPWQYKKLEIKD